MAFQACMTFLLQQNTREDVKQNSDRQPWLPLTFIESSVSINGEVFHFRVNFKGIVYPQKKKINSKNVVTHRSSKIVSSEM